MSAALERLKQQNEHDRQRLLPETSDAMLTTLTSILDVVEQERSQLKALADGQKKLAGFVMVMEEQQTLQLENLASRVSTSPTSNVESSQIVSVENRLAEIETTLSEFVTALDGRQLREAATKLITEASRNRTGMTSAVERAAEQVSESTELVNRAHGAASRIEVKATAAIQEVTGAAADAAATKVSEKVDAAQARAEKVMALVSKVEARQVWSAAGAMCLVLLPAATVVLGGILIVAGVVFGWEVALSTEAATWLRWVRGIGAVLGTVLAVVGLVAAVRWVAGHVSEWSGGRR